MVVVNELDGSALTGRWHSVTCGKNYDIYAISSTTLLKLDFDFNIIWEKPLGFTGAKQVEYIIEPFDQIMVRIDGAIWFYDSNGDHLFTYTGHGDTTNDAYFTNAHPGRAMVKFHYLGLTKQF